MTEHKGAWKAALLGVFLLLLALGAVLTVTARSKGKKTLSQPSFPQQSEYAGGDACFACHDLEEAFKKNPHYSAWEDESKPWSERGCETCHGPGQAHMDAGGDVEQIFRFDKASAKDISETCLDCHLKSTEEVASFLRNEHGLNSVACTECHSIHTPRVEQALLKARQPALCYDCHNEVRGQFNRPFHHKVHEGLLKCTDCHDQHGGYTSFTSGLVANTRQLSSSMGNWEGCANCHPDKAGPFVFEHQPVRIDGCGSCHTPHGSNNPRLLIRSEQRGLCFECHTAIGGDPGPPAPSFHRQTLPFYTNCTTCHVEIHGSNLSPLFFVD